MSSPPELACNELVEIITDHLEGALSDEERARFDAHLDICEGCRTYLEQMRVVVEATGMLGEDSIPDRAMQQLLGAFRTWKRG